MRTSFILYTDMCALICKLRDAEAGRVFKAIIHYAFDGEIPANLRGASEVCFEIVRKSLDRDWERYDEVRRRRAEAGRGHPYPGTLPAKGSKCRFCRGKRS